MRVRILRGVALAGDVRPGFAVLPVQLQPVLGRGVCEPECPPEAILPDTDPTAENWLELNRQYSESWPNITRKGESPGDADAYKDEAGKFDKYFSANPGQGS